MDAGVLQLIRNAIPSIWTLETLLLLRRSPDSRWTASAVAGELRNHPKLSADVLTALAAAGLVRREEATYRYLPVRPELDDQCRKLEEAYRERPVAVVNAIVSSKALDIRELADAFRLSRGKDPRG